MKELVINTLLLSAGFLGIFLTGELLYHAGKFRAETTRKFVHITSGILTLAFPLALKNFYAVLVLCLSFALILAITRQSKFLRSIHGVQRETRGSFLFPAAVLISFAAFSISGLAEYYYLPVLILAVSDPAAATVGKLYPAGRYNWFGDDKTATGSGAFFLSAFFISFSIYVWISGKTFLQALIPALGVSLAGTFAEASGRKGADNILIPLAILSTLFFLGLFS